MDLVTRLLLETGQFDSNLQKSTSQVRQFQNAGKSFMSAIGGLAAGFGLAMGASEAFKKTIASTQTTGDAFVKMTEQGKAGLNSFYVALASGAGFASFIQNMDNVVQKAGVLADVLDNLETKTLFSSSELDDLTTKKALYESIYKDRTKSDQERNAALEKTRLLQKEMIALQKSLAAENKKASYATIDAALAQQGFKGNVSRKTIDYLLKESNREKVVAGATAYNQKISGFQEEANKGISTLYGQPSYSKEYYEAMRKMDAYNKTKEGQIGQLYAKFIEMPDDEASMLKKAVDLKKTANAQYAAIASTELELNDASAKINKSYNQRHGITSSDYILEEGDEGYNPDEMGASAKKKALVIKGSMDEVNKQIADARTKYDAAATDQLRAEIMQVITDLEQRKIKLDFEAQYGKQEDFIAKEMKQGEIGPVKVKYKLDNIGKREEKSDGWIDYVDTNKIDKKDVAITYDYADGLNAVANMMSSITQMTKDGASEWLTWGATILTTVGTAIPAITALIALKKQEAVVNGVASVTQTPIVGWLMAGAAAMSVIAAISTIPAFANGGIVPGSSYSGDRILAGLNSGEMVLNKGQQANLFRQLNEGGGGNVPTVKLKISGTDLVGVINNYESKTRRLR